MMMLPPDPDAVAPHVPEHISSDWMRSNLRSVLDRVAHGGARFILYRRGKQVAGLVPPQEALALYELATKPARLRKLEQELIALQQQTLADSLAAMAPKDPVPEPQSFEDRRAARERKRLEIEARVWASAAAGSDSVSELDEERPAFD